MINRPRGLVLLVIALSIVTAGAGALTMSAMAAKAALQGERVVLENAKVRVIEYTSKPTGAVCGIGTHSHPAHVTIVLTPARDRVTAVGGKPEAGEMKVGDVYWSDGETHTDVTDRGRDQVADTPRAFSTSRTLRVRASGVRGF